MLLPLPPVLTGKNTQRKRERARERERERERELNYRVVALRIDSHVQVGTA